MKNIWTLFLGMLLLAASATGQTLTVLKSFEPDFINTTGFYPKATLIAGPSNTLFGTAYGGGPSGYGVVFEIQTNGSGLTVLWNFSGGSDGANPVAGLLLSGTTLYGTTFSGGASNFGTVFALNTDGSGFTNLYDFTGGNGGANPTAALVLSGSTLYGTSLQGGSKNLGTVFALNTDGSGFTNLRSFTGGVDCGNPYAGLLLAGGTLYGTTTGSNAVIADFGSVFKINTNGSGFAVLKTFLGTVDFANPFGGLVISGSTLYGTTADGNNNVGYGTVFSLNTNGGAFATLHSFDFTDGDGPYGTLVLSGSTLYGTTFGGGSENYGSIFKISTSGSGFASLYSFTGGSDGGDPYAGLVLSGGTLYGAASDVYTPSGNGYGGLFSIAASGSDFTELYTFPAVEGSIPYGGLVLSGGSLYGTTSQGGASNQGTVFSVNTSNGSFAYLHDFAGEPSDGSLPYGTLILGRDGNLYGTTYSGGTDNDGTVFQMTTNGVLATLVSFDGTDGSNPYAGLSQDYYVNFYVSTYSVGGSGYGTVFRMTTNGALSTLASFGYTNGESPYGSLVLGNDGNFYGTTYYGGSDGYGTVFQVTANGTLATLVSFAETNGANPQAGLTLDSDGSFYGTTTGGGSSGEGTVFRITPLAPSILGQLQPSSQIVALGSNVTISANVFGALPLICQWTFNGTNLPGETNTFLTLTNVSFSQSGSYSLLVTNNLGASLSSKATVTVVSANVTTLPATGITASGAELNGGVLVGSQATLAWFEWGTDTRYGNVVDVMELPGNDESNYISTNLSGLSGNVYHYRIDASNDFGIFYGADQSFTIGSAPQIVSNLPAVSSSNGVTFSALVNPDGWDTTVYFRYGIYPYPLTNLTPAIDIGAGATAINVSVFVTNLVRFKEYTYSVVASNYLGEAFGPSANYLGPPLTSAPLGEWESVAASADGTKLVAGSFLYTSTNAGSTWTRPTTPFGSVQGLASSADGTKLVAVVDEGFIYVSTNSGTSWAQANAPVDNWNSVASSADGSNLVAVAESGGIFTSTNSGLNWTRQTNGLVPSTLGFLYVATSTDGGKIVAASSAGTNSAIYISTNAGLNWIKATNAPLATWYSVASSANGNILMAGAYNSGKVYISTDSGATWTNTSLPSNNWNSVAESADGTKMVALANSGSSLLGFGKGGIYTSTNSGEAWVSNSAPSWSWCCAAMSPDGDEIVATVGYPSETGGICVLQNMPAPVLDLAASDNGVAVSWTVPSLDFTLQQSLDLSSWTDVTNPPVLDLTNLQHQVALPPPSANTFYRLIH